MSSPSESIQNRNGSFAILPSFVMDNENLDEGAKILYARISMYSQDGRCWASNAHFAEKQKVTTRCIQKWLKQLSDFGYIEVEIKTGGFQTQRNIWIVIDFKNNVTKRTTVHPLANYSSPPTEPQFVQTMYKQDKEDIDKDNVSRKKTMPRSTDQKKTMDAKRRWKLTDDQYQNLVWLQDNGINSDEGTLAHWVKTYPFERLYDVLNHAKSKKPTNIGAYMQKLFKTDAIVENNTIKANASFAKDFAQAHGWNQLKVLGKYCTFPMNGIDIEIPLSLNTEDFIKTLIEKHESFTGKI